MKNVYSFNILFDADVNRQYPNLRDLEIEKIERWAKEEDEEEANSNVREIFNAKNYGQITKK